MTGTDRWVIDKGRTVAFDDLPDRAAALDGYCQGPRFDSERRRFSFDHHAGCVRHATLSTCEMVLDAIRVGLDPSDLTVYINDLDADTVLSVWLLGRPGAADSEAAIRAIRDAGRLDALGPAEGGPGLAPALRWALDPMLSHQDLRSFETTRWRAILEACLARLNVWHDAGAPRESQEMPAPEALASGSVVLYDEGSWRLVLGPGLRTFVDIYASGCFAGVVAKELAGTWEYQVGKASEFVAGFDVPALLAALRAAELAVNPAQDPAYSWGGGSTIGGSPRNPDGTGSRLKPDEVYRVCCQVIASHAASEP